jgi:hypothetical protein
MRHHYYSVHTRDRHFFFDRIPGTGIEPLTTKICLKVAELGFFEGEKNS